MTGIQSYIARIDAVEAQRQRIYGTASGGDIWGGTAAQTFRADPQRELDANLTVIASYLQPQDVFVDVGGGAGRVSLPMSHRCREVVSVEPSPGMAEGFRSLASDNQITNASVILSSWLDTGLDTKSVSGDVVFTADVTYFVRDIEEFIRGMEGRAKRRAMITVWSQPPPNRSAEIFQLIYGERLEALPGYRELLAVLWEMGILPDVRVLPDSPWWESVPTSREQATDLALRGRWLKAEDQDRARRLVDGRFDELFETGSEGFQPKWRPEMREILITWETGQRLAI